MKNNYSLDRNGELICLIAEQLLSNSLLTEENRQYLSEIFKKNYDFGTYYDIDLNEHSADFAIKKLLFSSLDNRHLDEIYDKFLNFSSNECLSSIKENSKNSEEIISISGKSFNSFLSNKRSKLVLPQRREDFIYEQIKSFKHVKSILGHISIVEENINPVPIYCLSFSEDDKLIFTGDNNGLIKIWSASSGQLVEVFKSHEKAVNDTLVVREYLISCSEDKSVKIWDTKNLIQLKTLNFGEPIIRISLYDYKLKEKLLKIIIAISSTGKIYLFDLDEVIENEEYNIIKLWFDKVIIEKYGLKRIKLQHASMTTNSGLLVCGFNDGLVCVWDLEMILENSVKYQRYLSDFSRYILFCEFVHNSIVHLCDFNKSGSHFYTGATDGTVLVWYVNRKVIEDIRNKNAIVDKNQKDYIYPIYNIFKITESENRVRCQVNEVVWSCYNNYIVSMISSRKRKKNNTDDNTGTRTSGIIVYDINNNIVIKNLNEDNGFKLHDECYVLEAHPKLDDVILTVTNSNEVILLNFMTNQIISKFSEENYFFSNISQNIIALEGKFSNNGHMFVISTYLGSISIYTISSKIPYITTYMNQFFNTEFQNNPNELDLFFPKFVNMFNLPYIIQQPYSKLKMEQIFKNKSLLSNFNMSDRDISLRMMSNEQFENNLDNLIYEVEREEKIFSLAAKENLTYMIQENLDIESDESQEEESEIFTPEEIIHDDGIQEEIKEDILSQSSESLMDIDYEEGSEKDEIEMYNLRSRKRKKENVTSRAERYNSRNRVEEEKKSEEMIEKPKRKRLRKMKNDILEENEEDIKDNEEDEITQLVTKCYELEELCFLCKFYSNRVIGPFITDNYIDFRLNSDHNSNYQNFYFHTDCLITYNDYLKNSGKKIDYSNSIKAVIENAKVCWRCDSINATKKCSNCEKFFHGFLCLQKYSIEIENYNCICLECYREKSLSLEEKILSRKNNNLTLSGSKVNYKNISRNLFKRDFYSVYSYFPQIGDKAYFILQPYEEFLRTYFYLLIFEIDNLYFWKADNIRNKNYSTPFLCEVIEMKYTFPNNNTIKIMKRIFKNKFEEEMKILIKLKLKILDGNYKSEILELVFFENNQPDFLIVSENYDSKKDLLRQFKCDDTIEVCIGDNKYEASFLKLENKELNEKYKDSPFENMIVKYKNDEDSSLSRISIWEIFCKDHKLQKNSFENVLKFLQNTDPSYSLFYQEVDEYKDNARDYYNYVAVPMYLQLILSRLENSYYIGISSLMFDFELILENSISFNGENSNITRIARRLIYDIKNLLVDSGTRRGVRMTKSIEIPKEIYDEDSRKTRRKVNANISNNKNMHVELKVESDGESSENYTGRFLRTKRDRNNRFKIKY